MGTSGENFLTLATPKRLDAASVEEFKAAGRIMLESANAALVVDLSRTQFIDSAGLGSLVSLLKGCTQHGKHLVLATPTPQVRQIIELTRLHRLFDIYDSVDAARAALIH